jgi:hypothetical protein
MQEIRPNEIRREDSVLSSSVLYPPASAKQSEVSPLASWVVSEREGRHEHPVSTSRFTLPAIAFDLLHAIEVHPGWRKLSARHQRDLLVFASLANAKRTVGGDAEEIAQRLGLKCSKRLYARIAVWAKHGLVSKSKAKHTVDPETRRSTFLPGSSWQLLPAQSAAPTETSDIGGSVEAQKAPERLALLERHFGESITGQSRQSLFAALVESPQGVLACAKDADRRGKSPLKLFLRMVNDGDFRTKTAPAMACRYCGTPDKDLKPHNCVSANHREAA